MNILTEKINEIRDRIDFEINKKEELCLTSPELVKKALMIEAELSSVN